MKKLNLVRIALAWIAITWITLEFVSGIDGFPAKIQLFPALLAGNLLAVAVLLAVTCMFGRVYCSVLCPLGIFQDGVRFLAEKRKGKNAFHFKKENRVLRYGVLLIFVLALFGGTAVWSMALDPYGIFGRIVAHIVLPLWQEVVRAAALIPSLSWLAEKQRIIVLAEASILLALAYFAVIFAFAWFGGRTYCQTICPIGTLLGSVSRFAVFHPHIIAEKCVHCGACERTCRSSCVDVKTGEVDTSRCVDCMTCIAVCPTGAMAFGRPKKAASAENAPSAAPAITRREMIASGAAAVTTAAVALTQKTRTVAAFPKTEAVPVMPPGAGTVDRFMSLCTACHLCINRCKGHVLTPANLEYGIGGIFQPHLDFSKGRCIYSCKRCSRVCPTGAIRELSHDEKRATVMGKATYRPDSCLVLTEGKTCGKCAEHCPTKAVTMTGRLNGRKVPKIDSELCVGCGACEYDCPVMPKAIAVAGLSTQTKLSVVPDYKVRKKHGSKGNKGKKKNS